MKQRGLGKGLGALIDSMPESIEPEKKETNQLDVNEIDTDRKQPRKNSVSYTHLDVYKRQICR